MENTLRVLEHLSYVNECLIMGYSGDAKEELGRIITALRSNKNYEITNGHLIADQLETALASLSSGIEGHDAYRRSASALIRVNRELWLRVTAKKEQSMTGD